jgi:hypothetical protein
MGAFGPPPPGVDLGDDRRPAIIAVSIVTWVLALLAVGLRLVCRQMKGVRLWWDDWLIIASLVRISRSFTLCDNGGVAMADGPA